MKELKKSMILNILRTLQELQKIDFGEERTLKIEVSEDNLLIDCPNKDIRRGIEMILENFQGIITYTTSNYNLDIVFHN